MDNLNTRTVVDNSCSTAPISTGAASSARKRKPSTGPSFDELYAACHYELLTYAQKLSMNAAMADDVVQEAALRAFRSFNKFDLGDDPFGAFRGWMFVIIRNEYCRLLQNSKMFIKHEDNIADIEATYSNAYNRTPEEALKLVEPLSYEVENALQSLMPDFREVARLVLIEGMSCPDVAVHLGIPHNTVSTRMHRIRHHLTKKLAKYATAYIRVK